MATDPHAYQLRPDSCHDVGLRLMLASVAQINDPIASTYLTLDDVSCDCNCVTVFNVDMSCAPELQTSLSPDLGVVGVPTMCTTR